jgi:opacity protein-like surface antigen
MNSKRLILPTILAATLIMAATPSQAIDLGGHDRDGTVVGLTFGYGWNSIKFTPEGEPENSTGTVTSFSGSARVGWAPSDQFIGSIGFYGWKRSYYNNITPISAYTFSFVLEGYFFPRGEGFWIKGGIGRGTLDFSATAALPQNSINFQESGWTYTTGAGYEFRVSDGTGVGLCYDFLYNDVGDFAGFSSTKNVSHAVSLNFHFYIM